MLCCTHTYIVFTWKGHGTSQLSTACSITLRWDCEGGSEGQVSQWVNSPQTHTCRYSLLVSGMFAVGSDVWGSVGDPNACTHFTDNWGWCGPFVKVWQLWTRRSPKQVWDQNGTPASDGATVLLTTPPYYTSIHSSYICCSLSVLTQMSMDHYTQTVPHEEKLPRQLILSSVGCKNKSSNVMLSERRWRIFLRSEH